MSDTKDKDKVNHTNDKGEPIFRLPYRSVWSFFALITWVPLGLFSVVSYWLNFSAPDASPDVYYMALVFASLAVYIWVQGVYILFMNVFIDIVEDADSKIRTAAIVATIILFVVAIAAAIITAITDGGPYGYWGINVAFVVAIGFNFFGTLSQFE